MKFYIHVVLCVINNHQYKIINYIFFFGNWMKMARWIVFLFFNQPYFALTRRILQKCSGWLEIFKFFNYESSTHISCFFENHICSKKLFLLIVCGETLMNNTRPNHEKHICKCRIFHSYFFFHYKTHLMEIFFPKLYSK